MKGKTLPALIMTFCLALFVLGGSSLAADVYKIGMIEPLSGDLAVYGLNIQKGVDLAVEQINALTESDFNPHRTLSPSRQSRFFQILRGYPIFFLLVDAVPEVQPPIVRVDLGFVQWHQSRGNSNSIVLSPR